MEDFTTKAKLNNNAPRIYFNLNAVKESTTFIIRRNYLVSFSCNLLDSNSSLKSRGQSLKIYHP